MHDPVDCSTSGGNLYSELVESTRRSHRLFHAHWELTYRCNSRCTHCYLDVRPPGASSAAGAPVELSTAECLRVVDELAAAGVLPLTLSGGEPLVRHDWLEIAARARRKLLSVSLYANGTLITPEVADQIAHLHLTRVEISIYGVSADTHEAITQVRGSFERSVHAIRQLRERGVRVVMKTPLMRHNVREYHALRAMADELGAQFRCTPTITPTDHRDSGPLRHRMTDEDLRLFLRQTLTETPWQPRAVTPDQPACSIATNSITIDPYGTVYPCVQVRMAAGNLRDSSLQSIWAGSDVFRQLRSLTWGALPVCRACDLAPFCTRCHGLALVEDGDLRSAATENCREARIRREVLAERVNAAENQIWRNHR